MPTKVDAIGMRFSPTCGVFGDQLFHNLSPFTVVTTQTIDKNEPIRAANTHIVVAVDDSIRSDHIQGLIYNLFSGKIVSDFTPITLIINGKTFQTNVVQLSRLIDQEKNGDSGGIHSALELAYKQISENHRDNKRTFFMLITRNGNDLSERERSIADEIGKSECGAICIGDGHEYDLSFLQGLSTGIGYSTWLHSDSNQALGYLDPYIARFYSHLAVGNCRYTQLIATGLEGEEEEGTRKGLFYGVSPGVREAITYRNRSLGTPTQDVVRNGYEHVSWACGFAPEDDLKSGKIKVYLCVDEEDKPKFEVVRFTTMDKWGDRDPLFPVLTVQAENYLRKFECLSQENLPLWRQFAGGRSTMTTETEDELLCRVLDPDHDRSVQDEIQFRRALCAANIDFTRKHVYKINGNGGSQEQRQANGYHGQSGDLGPLEPALLAVSKPKKPLLDPSKTYLIKATLQQLTGLQSTMSNFEFGLNEGDEITLGKGSQSKGIHPDIVIKDDKAVSKLHCKFICRGGKLLIVDENSSNGTFVNGQRITEIELESSDKIQTGNSKFRIVF